MWSRQHLRYTVPAVAVLAVAAGVWPRSAEPGRQPGPRTVDEAAAVAEALGLYWATGDHGGVMRHHLVVSEMPLTRERVGNLRINDPTHPCWAGTVELCDPWRTMMANYDPACSLVWGELFVYGDPHLISRLTGRSP
jgi:hypothetical protein